MAEKNWKFVKLTVWLWLSLVSPVRSSVVGVAPWSALKPGSPSLVPPDRGVSLRHGDVKFGAGKGAHDLPSGAAFESPNCTMATLLCDSHELLNAWR